MSPEYAVIGKSVPRIDSQVKATGEAKYVGDMVLPGLLRVKLLRSPHAHARILGIDTSRAARVPGVKAIITGKDTLGIKIGPLRSSRDRQVICVDKVRFVGDCVAAVAAVDEDTAKEALKLIQVDYEPLPSVFDPDEALKKSAPRLHDHAPDNVSMRRYWDIGNVDDAFKGADYVREDNFATAPNLHGYLETDGCVAEWSVDGKLTMWVTTQVPFYLRRDLAMLLDLPYTRVRVIKVHVGGGFGGKTEVFDFHLAAAILAKKTGCPVKFTQTKREEFVAGLRRIPTRIWMKTGVNKEGVIVAQQSRVITDGGAYTSVGPVTIYNHGLAHMLPYRVPHFRHEALRVYTNNPVAGPKRGHGQIQIRFAIESQLDMIAEELGMDATDIRLKNALRPGDVTVSKLRIGTSGLQDAILTCRQLSGWTQKRGQRRGIRGVGMGCGGFACGPRTAALSDSSAVIKINEDGGAVVLSGASDIGQGINTLLAQFTAEVLGLTVDDVTVIAADTDTTPYDPGTYGSRVTFYAGNACIKAANQVKAILAGVAAQKLEVKPDDLEFRNRWVYVKKAPDRRVSFAELVRATQVSDNKGVIFGAATYYPEGVEWPDPQNSYKGNISGAYSFSAQVAEVEVDSETGCCKLIGMTMGDDCGYALNPMSAEGQVEGSVSNGQGEAMYEEISARDGLIHHHSYTDYKMPRATDTPRMETVHIETNDPYGPFGAKEVGEGFIIGTPGAIACAIHDASGVWVKEYPITAEKLFWAIKQGKK